MATLLEPGGDPDHTISASSQRFTHNTQVRPFRAGQSGEAVSLVSTEEHGLMAGIARLLKRDIPVVEVSGFKPAAVSTLALGPARHKSGAGDRKKDGNGWGHHSTGRGTAGASWGDRHSGNRAGKRRWSNGPKKGLTSYS